ncbi:unnamed protein product [Gordionus sp. m RMFG-2023]|uniref:uncharacterized protein LOC135929449 n=1 Tax=Gordionus sp. m RMFG-2023 TaxID=3053472 RepID=UPI0030E4BB69
MTSLSAANFEERRKALMAKKLSFSPPSVSKVKKQAPSSAEEKRIISDQSNGELQLPVIMTSTNNNINKIGKIKHDMHGLSRGKLDQEDGGKPSRLSAIEKIKGKIHIDPMALRPKLPQTSSASHKTENSYNPPKSPEPDKRSHLSRSPVMRHIHNHPSKITLDEPADNVLSFDQPSNHTTLAAPTLTRPKGHSKRKPPTKTLPNISSLPPSFLISSGTPSQHASLNRNNNNSNEESNVSNMNDDVVSDVIGDILFVDE